MPGYKVTLFRRGTTLQNASFTGAAGEITVDTNLWRAIVHDGVTPGGYPLQLEATEYARARYLTWRAALSQEGIASLGFSAGDNPPIPVPLIEDSGLITGAAVFSHQQGLH
jgi:hypothetical protein